MGLFLLQTKHIEQRAPPVYCPAKQGIAHTADNRFLISSTSQFKGLRGAEEYHLRGPKGDGQFGANDLFWGHEQN